jgi:serine/threonine-protein kinase
VAGPTLGERIAQGPVPVPEALPIAHQVAQALEAAHDQGVVHRDLKPDNVKLTADGRVKVLDFGLAKALEPPGGPPGDLTQSPTLSPAITGAMTGTNVILGTAGYMSPEQARGQVVDKRADIWAFGVVLFEMLTGRRLFVGETVSDTLAAVLRLDPDWTSLPASTPGPIRVLLRRCLERDPKRRLRDIGDARLSIEDALAGAPEGEASAPSPAGRPAPRRLLSLAALAAVIAAFAAGWLLKPVPRDVRVCTFEIPVEDLSTSVSGDNTAPALSPSGDRIAYITRGSLWVRDLARIEPREIPGTRGAVNPFWSPDGEWIGYGSASQLWKVRVSGGQPFALCDLSDGFSPAGGGAWGTDGRIVFCHGDGPLLSVSAQGGDPDTVLAPDPETEDDFHQVSALPGGRGVVFVVHLKGGAYDRIDVLAGGKRRNVVAHEGLNLTFPQYSPSGHILYHREPTNVGLWAVPFSLRKMEPHGEPFLAIPDVSQGTVAGEGTLVYAQGGNSRTAQLAFCDRTGKVERTVGPPMDMQSYFALSPDGSRVAIRINGENTDLWIVDTRRETRTRFTFGEVSETWPSWSSDGTRIYFQDAMVPPCTTFVKAADGTGEVRKVVVGGHGSLASDDSRIVYSRQSEDGSSDLWSVPLGPDGAPAGEPSVFLETKDVCWAPRFSPDGRFVAYSSDESGDMEIYLKRFPSGDGKWQVTQGGGFWPRWRTDGRELYFANDEEVYVVSVELGSLPVLGTPALLFARPGRIGALPFGLPDAFDVAPDGTRFLVQMPADTSRAERTPALIVVQDWAGSLLTAK